MYLDPEDVQDLVILLDSLSYDELEVRTGRLQVSLRRAGGEGWTQETRVLCAPDLVDAGPAPPEPVRRAAPDGDPVPPGLVAIRAPLPGTFYRAPGPGADPYVEVGSQVAEDTVVGLLETMKLFHSVHANVRGDVVEFLVDDAEPAGQDAILILVEPKD